MRIRPSRSDSAAHAGRPAALKMPRIPTISAAVAASASAMSWAMGEACDTNPLPMITLRVNISVSRWNWGVRSAARSENDTSSSSSPPVSCSSSSGSGGSRRNQAATPPTTR